MVKNSRQKLVATPRQRSLSRRRVVAPDDSGARSLAGYIYQLIGTAATRIRFDARTRAPEADQDILVEMESLGQDAAVTEMFDVTLIQFKYSRTGVKISPVELAETLGKLWASTKPLVAAGKRVRWQLHTNRKFTAPAKRLHDLARRQSRRDSIEEVGNIPSDTHAAVIQNLGGALEYVEYALEEHEAAIKAHARLYGMGDGRQAIRNAVGFLADIIKDRGEREVSSRELDDAIVGRPGARMLYGPRCFKDRQKEILQHMKFLGHPSAEDLIPRKVVEDLLRRPDIALAVLLGKGGTGKTASVLWSLQSHAEVEQRVVGALLPAPFNIRRSLPELVDSWRGLAEQMTVRVEDSLDQLSMANPGRDRPFAVLALDGVDELSAESQKATELIHRFWHMHQKPETCTALLIVTCRTRQEFQRHLVLDGTGNTMEPPVFETIQDFDERELAEVWRAWFGAAVPDRLIQNGKDGSLADEIREQLGESDIRRILFHPVMMGLLRSKSEQFRTELLDGGEPAWGLILEEYIAWFDQKVSSRTKCNLGVATTVLRAAATASAEVSTSLNAETHWMAPACQESGETVPTVKRVFASAATAGVIEADGEVWREPSTRVRWRWSFPLMAKWLRSRTPEDGSRK